MLVCVLLAYLLDVFAEGLRSGDNNHHHEDSKLKAQSSERRTSYNIETDYSGSLSKSKLKDSTNAKENNSSTLSSFLQSKNQRNSQRLSPLEEVHTRQNRGSNGVSTGAAAAVAERPGSLSQREGKEEGQRQNAVKELVKRKSGSERQAEEQVVNVKIVEKQQAFEGSNQEKTAGIDKSSKLTQQTHSSNNSNSKASVSPLKRTQQQQHSQEQEQQQQQQLVSSPDALALGRNSLQNLQKQQLLRMEQFHLKKEENNGNNNNGSAAISGELIKEEEEDEEELNITFQVHESDANAGDEVKQKDHQQQQLVAVPCLFLENENDLSIIQLASIPGTTTAAGTTAPAQLSANNNKNELTSSSKHQENKSITPKPSNNRSDGTFMKRASLQEELEEKQQQYPQRMYSRKGVAFSSNQLTRNNNSNTNKDIASILNELDYLDEGIRTAPALHDNNDHSGKGMLQSINQAASLQEQQQFGTLKDETIGNQKRSRTQTNLNIKKPGTSIAAYCSGNTNNMKTLKVFEPLLLRTQHTGAVPQTAPPFTASSTSSAFFNYHNSQQQSAAVTASKIKKLNDGNPLVNRNYLQDIKDLKRRLQQQTFGKKAFQF